MDLVTHKRQLKCLPEAHWNTLEHYAKRQKGATSHNENRTFDLIHEDYIFYYTIVTEGSHVVISLNYCYCRKKQLVGKQYLQVIPIDVRKQRCESVYRYVQALAFFNLTQYPKGFTAKAASYNRYSRQ